MWRRSVCCQEKTNPCDILVEITEILSLVVRSLKKIKGYVSVILGIVFCVSVLVGYIPIPEYIFELTCISNTLIGILLVFSGINLIVKGKCFPSTIYHMGVVTILLVCVVSCIGHFNFKGAFFFLHLVNPLVFFVYYIIFIDDKKNIKKVLYTPIPVIVYLAFDYVIGKVTGRFVYGIFDVNEMNLALMILIVCGVYILLIVLACITQLINKKMYVIRKKLHI